MDKGFSKRLEFYCTLNEDGFLTKILYWLYFTLFVIFILNIYFTMTIDFNKIEKSNKVIVEKKKTEQ